MEVVIVRKTIFKFNAKLYVSAIVIGVYNNKRVWIFSFIISGDELADFVYIQEELEKISVAVETLQLWCERMLDTGAIDKDQYDAFKNA